MIPVILVAALVLVLGRSSFGATRPTGTGTGGGSVAQPSIRNAYGALIEEIGGPMPKGAMFEIIRSESGGRPRTVVADQVTGASELGATALVVEHDAQGNPDRSSGSGAIGANVDPLTKAGAIYGAQWVYEQARGQLTRDIEAAGFLVPSASNVSAWISILQAKHSIGRSAFRAVLAKAKERGLFDVIAAYRHFVDVELPPASGRQTPEKIRLRLWNMLDLPTKAAANDPLPGAIWGPPRRTPQVPAFDAAKAKRYILAERARGTRPRLADGSPPGVSA